MGDEEKFMGIRILTPSDRLLAGNQVSIALRNEGERLFAQGNLNDALKSFERILDATPTDVRTLYFKAMSLGRLERHGEEKECLQRIIELTPETQENAWLISIAHKRIGIELAKEGDLREAWEHYDLHLKFEEALPKYGLGEWKEKQTSKEVGALTDGAVERLYALLEKFDEKKDSFVFLNTSGSAIGTSGFGRLVASKDEETGNTTFYIVCVPMEEVKGRDGDGIKLNSALAAGPINEGLADFHYHVHPYDAPFSLSDTQKYGDDALISVVIGQHRAYVYLPTTGKTYVASPLGISKEEVEDRPRMEAELRGRLMKTLDEPDFQRQEREQIAGKLKEILPGKEELCERFVENPSEVVVELAGLVRKSIESLEVLEIEKRVRKLADPDKTNEEIAYALIRHAVAGREAACATPGADYTAEVERGITAGN